MNASLVRWTRLDVTIHSPESSDLSNCEQIAKISECFGDESPTIQNDLNHRSLAQTGIYARLNTKAVDRALQMQADQLCRLVEGSVVLPALTEQTKTRNRRRRDDRPPPLEGLALLARLEEYDQILANTLWRPDRDVRRVAE